MLTVVSHFEACFMHSNPVSCIADSSTTSIQRDAALLKDVAALWVKIRLIPGANFPQIWTFFFRHGKFFEFRKFYDSANSGLHSSCSWVKAPQSLYYSPTCWWVIFSKCGWALVEIFGRCSNKMTECVWCAWHKYCAQGSDVLAWHEFTFNRGKQ